MENFFCYGCGAKLQTTSPNEKGYVPLEVLSNSKDLLCKRCFRMKNYGEETPNFEINLEKLISPAIANNDLIVYILDIFNLESSIIDSILKFIKLNPVLIVINKFDNLPKNIKEEKIIKYVQKRLKEYKLKIVDIAVCSAAVNLNISLVYNLILKYKKNKNVYLIGATSVGKSSLINAFLKIYSNETNFLITTSRSPGTTLELIEIPLPDNTFLFDTPGVEVLDSITNAVDAKNLKLILPITRIKPISFKLKPGSTLFFGSIVKFDYLEGDNIIVICYFSSQVDIHRVGTEKSIDSFNRHIGVLKPTIQAVKEFTDLTRKNIAIEVKEKKDIKISGYGFITIIGNGKYYFEVFVPKNIKVTVEESMI